MWWFVSKLSMGLVIILTLAIVIPNPLHARFPQLVKYYVDFQGNQPDMLDLNDLELAVVHPHYCTENSDCVIQLCPNTPRCTSYTVNKNFLDFGKKTTLPEDFCTDHPSACFTTYDTDLYAACINHTCSINRLFSPSPLPR